MPLVTATATAIGVLAVGVTAYTAAVKLAGAATKMFSSMMDANPIMLVATAIASVVAGLVVLETTIKDDTLPSIRDLTSAASDMNKTMDDATATRERTVESTVAAASVAEDYILRLKELEVTGLKTTEQENEHRGILIALCQLVPELSSYIDVENNLLRCSTDELLANTEAWKQNAIQKAYQEELTALYQKQADVALEVAMNTLKMGDAEDAAEAASTNHADALARMNELMAEAQEKSRAVAEETGYLADAESYLSAEYYELQAALGGYSDEMTRAAEETEIYKQAVETGNESLAAANEEIGLTEEAITSLTGVTEENTKVTGENAEAQGEMTDATGQTASQLNELSQAYQEAYKSARESIDSQIGLFDTFAASVSKDTDTVEEMMARWAEQTQNLATYTENLKLAAQYGLDEGLVMSLSDGSAESAGYLATIITEIERLGGTTEGMSAEAATFVEDFNASFAQTQLGKDQFATVVADLETDFQTAIGSMEQAANDADFSGMTEAVETELDTMGTLAQGAGDEVGTNLASSIESGKSVVGSAAQGVAQTAIDNLRKSWSSGSMNNVGRELVGDIAGGVKAQQSQLTGAVSSLGDGVTTALSSAMKSAVDSGMTEFSKVTARTRTVMNDLKGTVNSAASGFSLYSLGQELVNGMISGLNNRAGALYSAVRAIVNRTIITAANTAQVKSPSRRTTELFEYVGDGMVLGLENRRQKIADTAQSVVSNALKLDISGAARETAAAIDNAIPNLDIENLPIRNTTSTVQHNYGGFNIQIYQQPGEDADALAYRVMDVIQTELIKKEASIGG